MKFISLKLYVKYLFIISILIGNVYAEDKYVKDGYIVVLKEESSISTMQLSSNHNESAREGITSHSQ